MSQPWNPNVPPKGRVLATYAVYAGAIGMSVVVAAPWPWKLLAAIPVGGSVALSVASWRAAREYVRSWTEGETVPEPGSSSRLGPTGPYRARVARLTALVAGSVLVVMSMIAVVDYLDSHERPHERATVLAEHRVRPSSCTNGHTVRAEYAVTWRSENPPPGLPAVFTQSDACTFHRVGHSDTVIRRRNSDGSIRIQVSPFDSVADELILVAGVTLVSAPIGLVWAIWRVSKKPRTEPDRAGSAGA